MPDGQGYLVWLEAIPPAPLRGTPVSVSNCKRVYANIFVSEDAQTMDLSRPLSPWRDGGGSRALVVPRR